MELKFIENAVHTGSKGNKYLHEIYEIGNYKVIKVYIDEKFHHIQVNVNSDCCEPEDIKYIPSIIHQDSRKKDKTSHYNIHVSSYNLITMEEAQKFGKYLQEAAEVVKVLASTF